jgi:hypothetical protein
MRLDGGADFLVQTILDSKAYQRVAQVVDKARAVGPSLAISLLVWEPRKAVALGAVRSG